MVYGWLGARDMNRDDIVRRFEQWLDEALAAEDPPDGIDAEMLATMAEATADANIGPDHPGDSYTMWAAMTALTHEVKLQRRAFKELHNTLGTQTSPKTSAFAARWCKRNARNVVPHSRV